MSLEVQALAGGVCRQQDAQRLLRGVRVEPSLNFLPPSATGEAIDYLDTFFSTISTLDRLFEDRL